jgi:hypothetical protein
LPSTGPFCFLYSLSVVGLLTAQPVNAQSSPNNSPSELGRLIRLTSDADRRGDFKTAIASAEACVALRESMPSGAAYGYCENYLGKALLQGKVAAGDARRGFTLIKNVTAADPDGSWALDLAEAYLDGKGVARDPVEAAVITWRVEHGAFSIYSPYWGMCTECSELYRNEAALDKRLNSELTSDQKQQAISAAAERYPEIARTVKRRNTQMTSIATVSFALIASAIWWRRRRRTVRT